MLNHVWRDLRYAARTLGRAPAFATVAVLTLALGIGANTAMFSVVYGVLLRPLPYRDANRLMLIQREQDLTGSHRPVPLFFSSQVEIDEWRQGLQAVMAGLALAMAIVGLYGVVAYSVAQRTKEIGIHMALGARGGDVLKMVLREGLVLAGVGIAGGLAISVAATRTLAGLVYGIAPTDVGSYAMASAILFSVAAIASYLPARRATRVDPLVALRHE